MNRTRQRGPLALACAALALAACAVWQPVPNNTPVPDSAGPMPVFSLDQGWDQKTQMSFWFTSQGSQIIPYRWFLVLERAESAEPFRSRAHIEQLGYLPADPGPGAWNPDGLPVGFTRATDAKGQDWMGLSCAACHTGQINFKGRGLRIDGAPALADFNRFFAELVAALQATQVDEAKFQRFATALGQTSPAQQQALREALAREAAESASRLALNRPTQSPGHARLDAFGNIFNEVLVTSLDLPANALPPNAPVSYPFLWDTPQHDKVQWNGSAPNGPIGLGEVTRNVGEVLGVFGNLRIEDCKPIGCRYPSSVDIRALGHLEGWLRSLWSPQWDEKLLGPLDRSLAKQGEAIYGQQCAQCHLPIERTNPYRRITAQMHDVGTDPTMATAVAMRQALTGRLQGVQITGAPLGTRYGAKAPGATMVVQGALGVMLSDIPSTLDALILQYEAQLADELRGAGQFQPPAGWTHQRPTAELLKQVLSSPPAPGVAHDAAPAVAPAPAPTPVATYKARPLNGIWATAPYLHNGSVPSLWALLQPVAQRPARFFVGSREFDPVRVGLVSDQGPSSFDTTQPGNGNTGHLAGTTLPEADKRALLEYLKTL